MKRVMGAGVALVAMFWAAAALALAASEPARAYRSASQAVEAAGRDKKVIGGRLHFVLPTAIGRVAPRARA